MATKPKYEASINIPSFAGINQSGDGYNQSLRYARAMENVNVTGGSFQPMREGLRIAQTLDKPIGTLAYLHRRYTAGDNPRTLLVAISDGKVYTKALDQDDDWVQRHSGLTNNDCDWVTYEANEYPVYSSSKAYSLGERCTYSDAAYKCTTAIGTGGEAWDSSHWASLSQENPVDVLLFTNANDGMFCLYGDDLSVVPVATPKKFGVIARFNERIWGTGIITDPDSLMYSVPYNPFDWTANAEIPEDGAGEIMQPSWDGDSFVALRQYGAYLLAIKRNAIWRIYGTNPGEFVMQQQYGGGTIEENTVAISDDYLYMLNAKGVLRFDGTSAVPFHQDAIKDLMEQKVNLNALQKACAAMRNGVYCLALPVNGSEFCNAILEYNTREYTFSLRTNITVDAFLQMDERLFYTSAIEPGRVIELRDDIGTSLPCVWESGYQDMGLKSSTKSAFLLYLSAEAETSFELYLTIRTEKKVKEKIITIKPGKTMRIHLNNQGRYFRLEIKSYTAVPYIITGGIKIDLELDPD